MQSSMCHICFVLLLILKSSFVCADTFVYVSLSGQNQIEVHQMDSGGSLVLVSKVQTPGDPGGIGLHPSKKFLVAAMRDAGKLVSFAIDRRSGTLRQISEVKVDVDPAYVEFDKSGRFLLTAYYVTGKAAIHKVTGDGRISKDGNWYTTDRNAHAIVTDKENRWAFVPHTGPNTIFQFRFDVQTGTLKPNGRSPRLDFEDNTGPRHFVLHPNNRFGFCDNEQGSSVTSMRLNEMNGTLEPLQTLSTIPSDFSGSNTCARMMLHPNGKLLYASNRGHNSIAGFSIDPKTGDLDPVGVFLCEDTPRGFDIDQSGEFLVAAGQKANRLAVYRIGIGGALKKIGGYPTGVRPWWVTTVTY